MATVWRVVSLEPRIARGLTSFHVPGFGRTEGTSAALAPDVVVASSAGQRISGTLRLVRPIAEGGMGSVWIAEHLVLGREVAVKRMAPQWAAMPNARTRFLREARTTARIESAHVVRVLDCRIDEADEPYLVLELLQGETLEQRVRRHGPLSVYEVEEIVTQTCAALEACHAAGVVHRDVKPENVFLLAGGATFVKLLDFGIAKPTAIEECLDVDRLPAGTPQYMSPEHMFEPETTDERSDLFSLGAVAYFALTGRSPFEGRSLEGVYIAIEQGNFERPSRLRPEVPPALDAWFVRALARDRARRWQDANEMALGLACAIRAATSVRPGDAVTNARDDADDVPPTELPPVPVTSAPKWMPRRGALARAAAVIAAAAAATALVVWRTGTDVPPASAATTETSAASVPTTDSAPEPGGLAAPAAESGPPRPKPAAPAPATRSPTRPGRGAAPLMDKTDKTDEEASEAEPPDPERVTTSIQELIGSVPKPDLAP